MYSNKMSDEDLAQYFDNSAPLSFATKQQQQQQSHDNSKRLYQMCRVCDVYVEPEHLCLCDVGNS